MRKIGIYSNLTARCGNAAYGRDLQTYLSDTYTISLSDNIDHLMDCEVVIINWHSAVVDFSVEIVRRFKDSNVKIILVHQNSDDSILDTNCETLKLVDIIITHEDTGNDTTFIPVGIPIVDDLSVDIENKIGTAGFAFPWKRFDVVAEVAKTLNTKAMFISPEHSWLDTSSYIEGIRQHIPELAEVHRTWMETNEVVRLLSQCTVNIFWFNSYSSDDSLGQTGSARMGVAARRPMIISRHRKFRTLLPYEDELYVAETESDLNNIVKEIFLHPEKAKRPNRVLQDQGWPTVANKYKELIDSL